MVDIRPDRKGRTWIITRTDGEGFYHQLNLTEQEMDELARLWTERLEQ
jgi:hypothetical protein